MNASNQTVVQYLNEARTSEVALVRMLQAQIAMTPRGSYRSDLETHLSETRKHAARTGERLEARGQDANPFTVALGFWQSVIGQGVALSKIPFDLVRGSGGEEKVLKNAQGRLRLRGARDRDVHGDRTAREHCRGSGDGHAGRGDPGDEQKMLQYDGRCGHRPGG